MAGLTIAGAPQAEFPGINDRIPVSQGDGLPKTITLEQIHDLIQSLNPSPYNTQGQILYSNETGDPVPITKGADGQVLAMVFGVPVWTDLWRLLSAPPGCILITNQDGSQTTLNPGSDGQMLSLVDGMPAWITPP